MKSTLYPALLLLTCLLPASSSASIPSLWKPRNLQQSICSCSPRSFTVTLNLLQSCLDNTLEPNAGISSPTECTIEVGDPDASSRKLEHSFAGIANRFDEKSWDGYVKKTDLDNVNSNLHSQNSYFPRHLQDDQTTKPASITSITFIELNAIGTVINVDDQYKTGSFDNGSSISLQSISSTISENIPIENQLELVPSTQVLFMEGLNSAGEEVRGRFVWNYTNSCASNAIAIQQGDALAWVMFTDVEEQLGAICPASEDDVPTLAPLNVVPLNPTKSPTILEKTGDPTILPTATPSTIEEGPSPTVPPTQAPFDTIAPTVMPSTVTIDTIEPSPQAKSLDPSLSPISLEPTLVPTLESIDTIEPTSAPTPRTPKSSHAPNKELSMSMSMQQYYINPQRSENTIDSILDHFDVIHVRYNGNMHDKSRKTFGLQSPTIKDSESVKNRFDVIHIGDDENIRRKSYKDMPLISSIDSASVKIRSKSGKNEKSSKTSSGNIVGHSHIEYFMSRSRYSRSGGGGSKIGASKGDKGGKSSIPIGHKSSKTIPESDKSGKQGSHESSGKSGKGSGKSGKGSLWK